MRLTIVGCGDAFGSGGRSNTCFWVEAGGATIALDFGATALVEMKRRGLSPDGLDAIVLSHLHGDHFGGIPFLLLDCQFDSRRARPLTIIGPVGTAERIKAAQEVFFPGTSAIPWRFPLNIVDLPCRHRHSFEGVEIETREVIHPSGAPATGVRMSCNGRILGYSGDTSWTDALFGLAQGCDLFVCDCLDREDMHAPHLDLPTLIAHRPRFDAGRVMLTHMSDAMLDQLDHAEAEGFLLAHDGLVIDV